MSPLVANRTLSFLDEHKVPYEVLTHRSAFTSQDVAASLHVSGWNVAKVVVVQAAGAPAFVVVLPAACRLDLQALARVTGKQALTLASEGELRALFPDCELGAMPPFGNLYGVPVLVDACLPRGHEFIFQAGSHSQVVRLSYGDFERLVRPVVADVCRH